MAKGKDKASDVPDRLALGALIWGKKKVTRLNRVLDPDYCGKITLRELVTAVLHDSLNFPNGLDTPLCIGDFEGNFCTNILSFTVGGPANDHLCMMGDPHGAME